MRLLGIGREDDGIRCVQTSGDQFQVHGRLVSAVGLLFVWIDPKRPLLARPAHQTQKPFVRVGSAVHERPERKLARRQGLGNSLQILRCDLKQ